MNKICCLSLVFMTLVGQSRSPAQSVIPVKSQLIKQFRDFHTRSDKIKDDMALATSDISNELAATYGIMRHLKSFDKKILDKDVKNKKSNLKYATESLARMQKTITLIHSNKAKSSEMFTLSKRAQLIQSKINLSSRPYNDKVNTINNNELKPYKVFLKKEFNKIFITDGQMSDRVDIHSNPESFTRITWYKNDQRIAWSHVSYKTTPNNYLKPSTELGMLFHSSSSGSRWAVTNLTGNLSISTGQFKKKELMTKNTTRLINIAALKKLNNDPRIIKLVEIHRRLKQIQHKRSEVTKSLRIKISKISPRIHALRQEGFVDKNTYMNFQNLIPLTQMRINRSKKEIHYLENYQKYALDKKASLEAFNGTLAKLNKQKFQLEWPFKEKLAKLKKKQHYQQSEALLKRQAKKWFHSPSKGDFSSIDRIDVSSNFFFTLIASASWYEGDKKVAWAHIRCVDKMNNKNEALAGKYPVSSISDDSIWFYHGNLQIAFIIRKEEWKKKTILRKMALDLFNHEEIEKSLLD